LLTAFKKGELNLLTWQSPLAFALLIPLLAAVGWNLWLDIKKRPSLQFGSLATIRQLPKSFRARLKWFPHLLYTVALVLAVVALARPQRADTRVKKNIEGIDIMVVLDISDSMMIEDLTPNRIEAAKDTIKKFVTKRVSDRIGFIIFSGESYTRVPLTLDYPLLLQNVSQVEISRNIKMGTAIGVALANAVARLKDSTAKSRVIVFLTDGENNTGTIDPETALEIAKGYGLKIYTIGIGKDGDSQLPIETIDAFGRKVKRYQPIHSTVNDELLGKMASDTGGKYYRATDSGALRKVFNDIDRLEKTKIDVNQYTKYAELFPPWVEWATGLAIAALLLAQTLFRRLP
jgi:Ca-activated chloride channel family protein